MTPTNIIALDVGERRVGVAIASLVARIPSPLTTLEVDKSIYQTISQLAETNNVKTMVVGLPRNLSGDSTQQTEFVKEFAGKLSHFKVVFQDEALTSVKAEDELRRANKPYKKADVDALAATYILEDYLSVQDAQHA